MEYGYAKIIEKGKEDVQIKIETTIDPKEFFVTGDGLYVDSDFTSRILEKALPVVAGTEYKLTAGDLSVAANDATIESALPENHTFSESDVAAIIADLIAKQPKGIAGVLKNDGSWNIFYTPAFVVRVRWHSFNERWFVDAWDRGGHRCIGGLRVFSPAVS